MRDVAGVGGGRAMTAAANATATARRALEWALRLGLGALFVFAGVAKLRDPTAFATEVANYHWLAATAPVVAATLPAIEVVLGLAVVVAPAAWRRAAAVAMAGLLIVFTAAVAQAVARGINVDCGCFGGGGGPVTASTVARDVALLAAAGALAWLSPAAGATGAAASDPPATTA